MQTTLIIVSVILLLWYVVDIAWRENAVVLGTLMTPAMERDRNIWYLNAQDIRPFVRMLMLGLTTVISIVMMIRFGFTWQGILFGVAALLAATRCFFEVAMELAQRNIWMFMLDFHNATNKWRVFRKFAFMASYVISACIPVATLVGLL